MAVNPIPEQYHTVTPYLIVKDAAKAIEFYQEALAAQELFRLAAPTGQIGHAEIKIGDSTIMLADECPEAELKSPDSIGGTAVGLMIYVENCDQVVEQALSKGATILRPVQDQFYGDRSGTVKDPFGHVWTIGTHIEDVSIEEVNRRAEAFFTQQASG